MKLETKLIRKENRWPKHEYYIRRYKVDFDLGKDMQMCIHLMFVCRSWTIGFETWGWKFWTSKGWDKIYCLNFIADVKDIKGLDTIIIFCAKFILNYHMLWFWYILSRGWCELCSWVPNDTWKLEYFALLIEYQWWAVRCRALLA